MGGWGAQYTLQHRATLTLAAFAAALAAFSASRAAFLAAFSGSSCIAQEGEGSQVGEGCSSRRAIGSDGRHVFP